MKITEHIRVFAKGSFAHSDEWKTLRNQAIAAVQCVDWPWQSGKFTIFPEKQGNGVKPIKIPCIQKLISFGWKQEDFPEAPDSVLTPGDLDAFYKTGLGYVGLEWETGNISSSHRAVNKLLWALHEKLLVGAILIVPSDNLYRYLTDRIGNIKELRPYLRLWKSYNVADGVFEIIVIEYDATSKSVSRIPKGTDGRALV